MNRSEYETLMMAHDNLQRELSDIKRLMGKDKHELIKSNIALNKRVQELEQELHFCQVTKLSMDSVEKYTEDLKKQNKRYREALNIIMTLWIYLEDRTDLEWLAHKMSEEALKALEGEE